MKTMRGTGLALLGAMLTLGTTNAIAQHHGQRNLRHGPSYQIDRHARVIRDSHGSVIGRYQQGVIHQGSTYIVPHSGGHHQGTYYVQNGRSYYHPQTSSVHPTAAQPQQIPFGGFSQVDDLAARLETMSNEFCLDLYSNYSHNPGFQETYREAYQILQAARYVHSAEHQQDRAAIQQKLGGLDQLAHHIQGNVRGWSRHHQQQIGQLGMLSKMDLIESTLHHLMNDAGVRPTPIAGVNQAPPPAGGNAPLTSPPPIAPPPPSSLP